MLSYPGRQVTSSYEIASKHIQRLLEAYFKINKYSGEQEKKSIHYSCEGRIEKSVPRDRRLSSQDKLRDAKRGSSRQIFLSYPHTHDRFLYLRKPTATCDFPKGATENIHVLPLDLPF